MSFGSKVKSRTFGCIAMRSVVYFEVQITLIFCKLFCLDLVRDII